MNRTTALLLSLAAASPAFAAPEYGNYFCYLTASTGFVKKDNKTSIVNAVPADFEKFVLSYRPITHKASEINYCKDLLEKHIITLAKPPSALGHIANISVAQTCISSEEVIMKQGGQEWKYRGIGEGAVSFYGLTASHWIMFYGKSFDATFPFDEGPAMMTGNCEKIDTR